MGIEPSIFQIVAQCPVITYAVMLKLYIDQFKSAQNFMTYTVLKD